MKNAVRVPPCNESLLWSLRASSPNSRAGGKRPAGCSDRTPGDNVRPLPSEEVALWAKESFTVAIQHTTAFGPNDSPADLCSSLLEKRRAWSDCGGDVERRFIRDELLTTMTLYWATQTYGTSARYYYEAIHNSWQPSYNRQPMIEASTAAAVLLKEIILMPRRWAESYYNLKRWTVFDSGGHFAPMAEPAKLVEDIRAFFRPLR